MNTVAILIAYLLGWLTGRTSNIGSLNFQVVRDGFSHAVATGSLHHRDDSDNMTTATNDAQVVTRPSLHPLEHSTEHRTFTFDTEIKWKKTNKATSTTDTFTPFHRYMMELGAPSVHKNFTNLPQLNSWLHYFEAYHNHMARFRGQDRVVFMEIGVQSGGKIPLLRKYFGPGLVYVGIDINPSTKMFETDETDDFTAHIEIGDSTDATFLNSIKEKYPHVDIFLDDGGHTMEQQITAMKHMLPHVQPEGVYMCEDLGTSWLKDFGGVPKGHVLKGSDFVKKTTVGFIYQTMDWFMATANSGKGITDTKMDKLEDIADTRFSSKENPWWRTIPSQVKHIHYYNQIVVYEKGVTYKGLQWKTIGHRIGYKYSGEHKKVNWKDIMRRLDSIFGVGLL